MRSINTVSKSVSRAGSDRLLRVRPSNSICEACLSRWSRRFRVGRGQSGHGGRARTPRSSHSPRSLNAWKKLGPASPPAKSRHHSRPRGCLRMRLRRRSHPGCVSTSNLSRTAISNS